MRIALYFVRGWNTTCQLDAFIDDVFVQSSNLAWSAAEHSVVQRFYAKTLPTYEYRQSWQLGINNSLIWSQISEAMYLVDWNWNRLTVHKLLQIARKTAN